MAERMVQVPVSLMDQAAEILEGLGYSSLPDHLRSLLSQPTPTIEFSAYNIVNQIGDVYSEQIPSDKWTQVRQSTNDRLWKWTEQMIASLQPSPEAQRQIGYRAVWDSGLLTDDPYASARIWRAVEAAIIAAVPERGDAA